MYKAGLTILLLCFIGLDGCAAKQPPMHPYYSHTEFLKMTYCFGMSDTTMHVAIQKLKHRPKKKLIDYYSSRPNAELNLAIVKKVYKDHFTSAWDYTVHVFNACALHLAGVSANRVGFASYCEQNTLIADAAYGYRKYGYSKQKVYKQFAQFKSKAPQRIVDRVYASHESRAAIKMQVWQTCMAKIPSERTAE